MDKNFSNKIKKLLPLTSVAIAFIVVAFITLKTNIPLDISKSNQSIVKNFTTSQLPSVPGEPIKWIKILKVAEINDEQHLLEIPKIANNVKISTSTANKIYYKKSSELTNADRKKLSELSKQASKSEASLALAESLKNKKLGFFSKISKLFSNINFSMFASVADAVGSEDNMAIDTTIIDLSSLSSSTASSDSSTTSVIDQNIQTSSTSSNETDVSTTSEINPIIISEENLLVDSATTSQEITTFATTSDNSDQLQSTSTDLTASTSSIEMETSSSSSQSDLIVASSTASSTDVVEVQYETPAPVFAEAETETGKIVTVSATDTSDVPIKNVLAYTNIPKIYRVGQEDKIKIKWVNNNDQNVTFKAYDLNDDGYLDYVEWTVPHLSTQTFEIIFTSKAFQLDADKNIIADIYDQIKTKDNNWANIIDGQYVRVTFEKILTNKNDNTLYVRPTNPNESAKIEVYPVYTDQNGNQTEGPLVAIFSNINREDMYKVLLTNLETPTDVFDLKIIGNVDIDYIVDPAATLISSYPESNANTGFPIYTGSMAQAGQSFVTLNDGNSYKLNSAKFYLFKSGSPTGSMYAQLYSHTGTFGSSGKPGTLLATSDAIDVSTLSPSPTPGLVTFTFSGANQYVMFPNTDYIIIFKYDGGDASNYAYFAVDSTPADPGNASYYQSGCCWLTYASADGIYYVYGDVADLGTGLIAHWKLNDNLATTNVVDNMGLYNGVSATNTSNMSTAGVSASTGGSNGAFSLNGTTDYISAGASEPIGGADFSISAWVYPTSYPGVWENDIVSKWPASGANIQGFRFVATGPNDTPAGRLRLISDSSAGNSYSTAALTLNAWNHVVTVYHHSGTTVDMYVNNSGLTGIAGNTISSTVGTNPLRIGQAYGSNFFAGKMDDVRLYSRALSSNDVSALYNSGAGTEIESLTVPDAPTIGTATAGNAQATITFTAPGNNGGAAIDYYTASSSPSGINVATTSATSVVVTGLTNGTAYTFTIYAHNSIGTSTASVASNSITPLAVTTKYWVGTDGSWNTAGNWSATSGGAGGEGVPVAGDTVIFDGGGTGNANIDANVNVSDIQINSGYTGTITQTSSYTITTSTTTIPSFVQNSSGSTLTLINSNTIAGGLTLDAGILNINSATAIGSGTFTITGGTIDNTSGGDITLSTNNAQNWNGDFTFGNTNNLNLGTGTVTLGANCTITTNKKTYSLDFSSSGEPPTNWSLITRLWGTEDFTDQGSNGLITTGYYTGSGNGYGYWKSTAAGISTGDYDFKFTPVSYAGTPYAQWGVRLASNGTGYWFRKSASGSSAITADGYGSPSWNTVTVNDAFTISASDVITTKIRGTGSATTVEIYQNNILRYSASNPVTTKDSGPIGLGISGGQVFSTRSWVIDDIEVDDAVATVLTVPGVISGAHGLTKSGIGTLSLSGANTFSGGVTLNAGTLSVSNSSALGTGNFLESAGTFSGGSGSITIPANLTISSGTFTAPSGTLSVAGNFSNSGTFNANSGTINLNGTGQSITGSTTFYNFTKSTTATDTLTFAANSTTTIASGGTLTLSGIADHLLLLRSSATPTTWNLSANNASTLAISYVDVMDSDASSGKQITQTHSVDSGNNTNWVFDIIPPSISLTALSSPNKNNTPTFYGTSTDDVGVVTNVEFQMDGTGGGWTSCTPTDGSFNSISEAFSCTTSILADGSHTIYIRSTDNHSNTTANINATTDTFTIDTTSPSVPVIIGLPQYVNVDSFITISGTAEIGATVTPIVRIGAGRWDQTPVVADSSGDWTAQIGLFGVGEGEHYSVNAFAEDLAGNFSAESVAQLITKDTIPPIVDAGTDKTENTLFTQNATTSDATSGIASHLWSKVSGPGTITFGATTSKDTTVFATADGTYVLKLIATDNASNSASSTFSLVWNTATPIISNINPINGSNILSTGQLITFSLNKIGDCRLSTSLKSYDDMLGDTICSTNNGVQISCTAPSLGAAGTKDIYFACEDFLGNKDSTSTATHMNYVVPTGRRPIEGGSGGSVATTSISTSNQYSISINGGATTVDNRQVTLNFSASTGSDATAIVISTNPDFYGATIIPFQNVHLFDLCQGSNICPDTNYTIYAKFLNSSGTAYPVVSSQIFLNAISLITEIADKTKEAVKNIASTTSEIITAILPSPKKETVVFPPIEKSVTETPQYVFSGKWKVSISSLLNNFVFASLPGDFKNIIQKFPNITNILAKVGITKLSDIEKLSTTNISLPGLAETVGATGKQNIVSSKISSSTAGLSQANLSLSGFSQSQKNKIPTDIVFVRTADQSIDLNVKLSISNKGLALKTVNTIQGKPLSFVVKPGESALSVDGYLIFKSNDNNAVSGSVKNSLTASALNAITGKNVADSNNNSSPDLVLSKFEYKETENGIWTADVASPQVLGQYELRTIVNYKEKTKTSEQINMIVVVDPEGYVFEKLNDGREIRLSNAEVSIYWQNPETKNYELWKADDFRQQNPQTTDVTGRYSFLVPSGMYYLKVHLDSYSDYQGEPFQVEESKGVFINIELKAKSSWLKIFNLQTILLTGILAVLAYLATTFTISRSKKNKIII